MSSGSFIRSRLLWFLPAILVPAWCSASIAVMDSSFNPGANNSVFAGVVQPDGKIVVGGSFTAVAGQSRRGIARLHNDGSLDQDFNPGVTNVVLAMALQPDGKIIVGGTFTGIALSSRTNLARLNPDGTLDTNFNVSASATVRAIVVQPDGGILLAGDFLTLGGHPQERIGRLNPDGTVDTNFVGSAGGTVTALALQANGRILVGGTFTNLSGISCTNIGRLEGNGAIDETFVARTSGPVNAIAIQLDGKILIGGAFNLINGQSRPILGRLGTNGALDAAFAPVLSGALNCMVLQADGSLIAGSGRIARVSSDGVVDSTLNLLATSVTAILPDGSNRLVVLGTFTSFAGVFCNRIGRVQNNVPPQEAWTADESTFTWFRGGNHPELLRTEFHHSENSIDWTLLGEGERIAGGWQLTNVVVPETGGLRARGYLANANYFIDTFTPPRIVFTPRSVAVAAGSNATLMAAASGLNLTLQWLRDGIPVPGASEAFLTLTNVNQDHAGGYQIVASNAEGSVTSTPPARLELPLYVFTLAGTPDVTGTNDGVGMDARLNLSWDLTTDVEGNVYVVDRGTSRIRKITPAGKVSTHVRLNGACTGVALGPDGNMYVVNLTQWGVDRIRPDGTITNVAPLNAIPTGIVVDSDTNIFVAMWGDHSIRRITADGTVTVLAGQPGLSGYADGSPGRFSNPEHLDLDADGNLYVADAGNHVIRKITPNGIVSTYAGVAFMQGASNGFALTATFRGPKGVAVDRFGNVIVADTGNSLIRKITPDRIVTTLAGAPQVIGTADGPGSDARFDRPSGIGVDLAGNIYIPDTQNATVRKAVPNFNHPIITLHPQSQEVAVGSNAVFTVNALNGPHAYQWFADGNPVSGAMGASLTLTNVQLGAGVVYHVAITNLQGWALSAEAELTVVRRPRFLVGGIPGYTSDGFGLSIAGLSGHGPVVLHASTNLIDWQPILTNPPTTGTLELLDAAATNWPFRFYRIEEE